MRFSTTSALTAALALAVASGMAFPVEVKIHNDVFLPNVETETSTYLPAYGEASVTVRDADQLVRILSNIEQLNSVNGWTDGAGLSVSHDVLGELALKAANNVEASTAPPATGGGAQGVDAPGTDAGTAGSAASGDASSGQQSPQGNGTAPAAAAAAAGKKSR